MFFIGRKNFYSVASNAKSAALKGVIISGVLDNETNTVVKISVGIGLLIDLWKVLNIFILDYKYKFFFVARGS